LFNELSRVPGIFLSAPASARTAAGSKSPADAAEILGVRHVLTGTAVNTDNALQVTASLIDVQENTTLWEDTFDGRPEDLFVIGGTVAHDVAAAMGLPVDDARSDNIGQVPDAPYAVWERYANARATTDREQALDKLAPVLESAPEFAAAEGLRARLLAEQALSGEADDPSALLDAATNHAEAALALDENNTDARMALALIQLALGALDDAIKNHQKTLEMQPNNVEAQGHLGIALTYAGRYDEAVKQLQGAVRRDPENSKSPYRAMLGLARFAQGDYEEAAAIWEEVIAMRGPTADLTPFRIAAFAGLQDADSANRLRGEFLASSPSYSVTNDRILRAFSGTEHDRLMTLLMAAGLPE